MLPQSLKCACLSLGLGLAVMGAVSAQAQGPVQYADQFPGKDAGAKITAALQALAGQPGTVDCMSLTGRQAVTSTVKLTFPVKLLFGISTFTVSDTMLQIESDSVGIAGTPGQTNFVMSTSAKKGTPIIEARAGVKNLNIHGLTFDASNIGPSVLVGFPGKAAVESVAIHNNRFTGTPMDIVNNFSVMIEPYVLNSQVTQNDFHSTAGGVIVYNAASISITDNRFESISGANAISVDYNDTSFRGQEVIVSGNSGKDLSRMAIEIWGKSPGGEVEKAVVMGNSFSSWHPVAGKGGAFGISVTAAKSAMIRNNTMLGGPTEGPQAGYGIEILSPGSVVTANKVSGFFAGITNHIENSDIEGNTIQNSAVGIMLSTLPLMQSNITITGNQIQNTRIAGIRDFGSRPHWSGTISNNVITRSVSWPGEEKEPWTGVVLGPPIAPSAISGNTITYAQSSPSPGLKFIGIRFNGAPWRDRVTVQGNEIINRAAEAIGVGYFVNSPGALQGVPFTNNHTEHLDSVWNVNQEELGGSYGNSDSGSRRTDAPPGFFQRR